MRGVVGKDRQLLEASLLALLAVILSLAAAGQHDPLARASAAEVLGSGSVESEHAPTHMPKRAHHEHPTPAPTATPSPPPTPTPPPPAPAPTIVTAGRAAIEPLVRDAWPGDRASEDSLVRIIDRCENPFWDPGAVSGTGDYGITQLNARTWRSTWERTWGFGPWDPNVFDVRKNVAGAWNVYVQAGHSFRPWSCRRFA